MRCWKLGSAGVEPGSIPDVYPPVLVQAAACTKMHKSPPAVGRRKRCMTNMNLCNICARRWPRTDFHRFALAPRQLESWKVRVAFVNTGEPCLPPRTRHVRIEGPRLPPSSFFPPTSAHHPRNHLSTTHNSRVAFESSSTSGRRFSTSRLLIP